MKLIIVGASGSVATELIRQSLRIPQITSVIAVSRRPVLPPSDMGQDADASKLHNVILENYDTYPDDVRTQLRGADACIWTVAITPSKSRGLPFELVRRVCHDYTLAGLRAIFEAQRENSGEKSSPLRFLYMSGAAVERDQKRKPTLMAQYLLMRGETENQIIAFAKEHEGAIEASVAKPGLIVEPGQILKILGTTILKYTAAIPSINSADCSAAMLHEVMYGFTKEPLDNDDLIRIGRQVMNNER